MMVLVLEEIFSLLQDHTLRTVAMGATILGGVSGALGCFAVLRRQSLVGDGVAHAALPGIALAFLLTGSKAPLVLMVGAALAGWLGTLGVGHVVRQTRLKYDTVLGLMMSVFFGFGLVLLTLIQQRPDARQAGLETFLFGQATALLRGDVAIMALLGGVVLMVAVVSWKELKLLSFDPDYGAAQGFPMRAIDAVLTSLLVIAIVIGLQTVGVVLMSAMVVAPAAAARQWTDRLGLMVTLGGVFGALSGLCGAVLSASVQRLPTGPTIVICASLTVLISLLVAPSRGVLWRRVRARVRGRRLRVEAVLIDLYELANQHDSPQHAHSERALRTMSARQANVGRSLEELTRRGWVQASATGWGLTPLGVETAERLVRERGVSVPRPAPGGAA